MLTLKTTKAVRDLMGLKPADLTAEPVSEAPLDTWYVNVFTVDRRKALIFMNERTLLTFVVIGVKKADFKPAALHDRFINGMFNLLMREQFPPHQIERVMDDCFDYRFAKTDSRSSVCNMNLLVFYYQHVIAQEGGSAQCDLAQIFHDINRMIMGTLNYGNPLKATVALLNEQTRKTLTTPEQTKLFADRGLTVIASTPDEFAAHIDSELKKWSRVVRERGLKVE